LVGCWAERRRRRQTVADLETRFFLGEEAAFEWGTTLATVGAHVRLTETSQGPRWVAECRSFLEVPTLSAVVQAPFALEEPIETLAYEITVEAQRGPAAEVLRHLRRRLGKPAQSVSYQGVRGSPSRVAELRQWEWGLASISVSIYGAPREVEGGLSLGCIWHGASEQRRALWGEVVWRARGGEDGRWRAEGQGCEAHVFPVPGGRTTLSLNDETGRSARDNEISSVRLFKQGFLAESPPWIASHIRRPVDEIVVWFHPRAKRWGIGTRDQTMVLEDPPVALDHTRISRGRGPGGASLGPLGGISWVSCFGEPEQLDELAAFLKARFGCPIEEFTNVNC
jgi:hypothetical protein